MITKKRLKNIKENVYMRSEIATISGIGIDSLLKEELELIEEIERLNNIIGDIERLIINHNCDTGNIYYKYNGKYLRSELKERIMELVELKENK